MASPILSEAEEVIRSQPDASGCDPTDENSKSIPTAQTSVAPRGRIIDNSARGTIFWEADRSDSEDENTGAGNTSDIAGPSTWGKPFKVEWISTSPIPFHRTRGLRNPWNANRDVKIARDGTELETNVGRKLTQMFHQAVFPGQGR